MERYRLQKDQFVQHIRGKGLNVFFQTFIRGAGSDTAATVEHAPAGGNITGRVYTGVGVDSNGGKATAEREVGRYVQQMRRVG